MCTENNLIYPKIIEIYYYKKNFDLYKNEKFEKKSSSTLFTKNFVNEKSDDSICKVNVELYHEKILEIPQALNGFITIPENTVQSHPRKEEAVNNENDAVKLNFGNKISKIPMINKANQLLNENLVKENYKIEQAIPTNSDKSYEKVSENYENEQLIVWKGNHETILNDISSGKVILVKENDKNEQTITTNSDKNYEKVSENYQNEQSITTEIQSE
jgi:hypothetical protein